MVLGGSHGPHGLAVGEGQKRALGAGQALLDDHGGTRIAEGSGEALADRLLGLLLLGSHDHALTSCQAICLHHERGSLLANIGERSLFVGKRTVRCRGNAGALHELLRKALGALHLRTLGTRSKAGDTSRAHSVGNTGNERGLGTDHHKPDALLAGKGSHRLRVVLGKRHVHALLQRASVTRRDVERSTARRLGKLLRERMLAAAASQKQDVDGLGGLGHGSSL